MSASLLGIQIDAVYHTALVFGGIEYFFGAGVQTSYPASTHHGRPMEIVHMGTTNLPLEIILEYLDSLKAIYTAEVRLPRKMLQAIAKLKRGSHTISFYTTVTTSPTILPCF